jgi:diguanylate cyclase (GGDEF)-like protein
MVGMVSALSGNVMLIILTALVMTGLTFGFCIVNAGAPRYVRIQVMLISLPFLLSTSFSGAPDMLILLLQTPFWIGGIFMMINTSHDRLAKLIQAQRTNRYLAFNDMLTGLANRAEIMATLDRLASKPRPRGAPAPYLLYLDLDGFKGVNDRYGHAAGDELLRIVADRLRTTLRNGDTLGRIGGDEFVVLLSDLPRDQLPALAERLTRVIADPFDLSAATGVQIGISIGGAPLDGSDPRQSMALADSMLYTAKAAGRSTYRLSGV